MYIKLSGTIQKSERVQFFNKSFNKYTLKVNEDLTIDLIDKVYKDLFEVGAYVVILGKAKTHQVDTLDGLKKNITNIDIININYK